MTAPIRGQLMLGGGVVDRGAGMTAYPPPDATREQVEAWERANGVERPHHRCAGCNHPRSRHGVGDCEGTPRCDVGVCMCPAFVEPTVTKAEIIEALGGKRPWGT